MVNFSQVEKWYVEYYLNRIELTSRFQQLAIKDLITPVKRLIKKDSYNGELPIVSKIVFKTGELIFRKERTTGMNLYRVQNGELIVSNINFHQGATAINTDGTIVCSTHYQPYFINEKLVDPSYLVMCLRSELFLNAVASVKAQGIKNESGYDFIGQFKVPTPSLSEQKIMVEKYNRLMLRADKIDFDAQTAIQGIDSLLFKELEIKEPVTKPTDNRFMLKTTRLTNAYRWEVGYLLKQSSISFLQSSKYSLVPMRLFIDKCQYGLSEKASKEPQGVPILRMNNIQDAKLDIQDLKYLPNGTKNLKNYILDKGDLLFNRTNSKELVGKTAIFDLDGQYVFASYLVRVVITQELADVEYINILFASKIIRAQIDLVSRQILGQANINAEEMKDLLFPLPPLEIQKKIKQDVYKVKEEIDKLHQKAQSLRSQAKRGFEEAVFGSDDTCG